MTCSEGHLRRIDWTMQRASSNPDRAQLESHLFEEMVIRLRGLPESEAEFFLGDVVEREDIFVVLQLLAKHSRKEHVLMRRNTATKKEYI